MEEEIGNVDFDMAKEETNKKKKNRRMHTNIQTRRRIADTLFKVM